MDELELNPLYEQLIDGLMENHYAVADGFFTPEEVAILRADILKKYERDSFKKSAIGHHADEIGRAHV